MHVCSFRVLIVLLALSLCACGGPERPVTPPMPKPAPVEDPARISWFFQPEGIRLIMTADKQLNALGDNALALSLCIYQLRSENPFATMAATKDGLLSLLECSAKDPSIVSATHMYVQPGYKDIQFLDRAEGAKYLAVVAGFNNLAPTQCISLVSMPIHSEKSGIPMFRTTLYEAADMDAFIVVTKDAVNLKGAERVY